MPPSASIMSPRMTLVLGVHRSGTSMLAAGLQAAGLDLGRLPAERDADNPRGYYENTLVRAFNDRLLKDLGSSWDDVRLRAERQGLDGPAWAGRRAEAAALLRGLYPGQGPFALKDPRVTQLLPFWTVVLRDLGWEQRHVLILRHPDEVAESQMQRAARRPGMFPRMNTPQAMHALWARLMQTAQATLPPGETILVRHDALRTDPRGVLGALAQRLGLSPGPDALDLYVSEVFDPALYRAAAAAAVRSPEREAALALWQALAPPGPVGILEAQPAAERRSGDGKGSTMTTKKTAPKRNAPKTGTVPSLPLWPQDAAAICEKIRSRKSPFKVVLKLKNEGILLPIWLKHYLAFMKPEEIIIADNQSTDPGVLEIYRSLDPAITLFSYAADPTNGFHNIIHSPTIFWEFHQAISDSCDHRIIVDCDELLVLATARDWTTDRATILGQLARNVDRSLATAWLETLRGSTDSVFLGNDEERLINALCWGKPIVPSELHAPGFPIHNVQFPEDTFATPEGTLFALLHLKNYSREQRLSVNRDKLVSRGLVAPTTSFEEIGNLDASVFRDPTAVRLVREIGEILKQPEIAQETSLPANCIRFEPSGQIAASNAEVGRMFAASIDDIARIHRTAFEIGLQRLGAGNHAQERKESPESLLTLFANARDSGDIGLAETILRKGLDQSPSYLDQFNSPVFCKELARLELSRGNFEGAHDLVFLRGNYGEAGWHHILFARALEARGRSDEALSHWQAFDASQPGHPEAQAALIRLGAKPAAMPPHEVKGPLVPAMTAAETALFSTHLARARAVLEFGAGGSTALAGRLGVPHIVSVESDNAWLEVLSRQPELADTTFVPVHVDIGTTGNWGFPTDPSSAPRWPSYYSAIWSRLDRQPDLVLVDGRFRVACTLSTLLNVRPDSVIVIHDFWARPHYHVVLNYLTCTERVDEIGIFAPKVLIDWKALARDLIAHAMDPR